MEILVVTGLSGAGKSTCLRALEDLGYYCVDNLPVPLLPALVETKTLGSTSLGPTASGGPTRIAVGIDARDHDHLQGFASVRGGLLAAGHVVEVLFLEAPDAVLVRRFSETRRRHPMGELPEAIRIERERLRELRALADSALDSETLTSRQLRQLVRDRYGTRGGALHLVLTSFGFKNGLPSEADLVLDARFAQAEANELLDRIESWLRFQAPLTIREGRSYLTVALGCTGGQHRSVVLIEALAARLEHEPAATPTPVLTVRHRDLERALADTAPPNLTA
jgi:UPF0042 nucleotide-binding protein